MPQQGGIPRSDPSASLRSPGSPWPAPGRRSPVAGPSSDPGAVPGPSVRQPWVPSPRWPWHPEAGHACVLQGNPRNRSCHFVAHGPDHFSGLRAFPAGRSLQIPSPIGGPTSAPEGPRRLCQPFNNKKPHLFRCGFCRPPIGSGGTGEEPDWCVETVTSTRIGRPASGRTRRSQARRYRAGPRGRTLG